jgi:TetR/AcrR family transcriptional regulator, tetracycline repressor protein
MTEDGGDVKRGPGRRPGLTREQVVASALELVEEDGLDGLSMRRLGARLGIEAMTLYTYVESKDDLLDAVAESVLSDLELPDESLDWETRIRAVVGSWAGMQRRHPNAFPLVYRGNLPTDAVRRTTEHLLDALRVAGFDEAGTALAYQTLVCFLDGALLGWPPESYRAGEAWRRAAAQLDRDLFPRQAEVAPFAAELRWDDVWGSGLDLLLRGLAERLQSG